jgi:acylphosphatase
MKHLNILVRGRVQGVFYRAFVREAAGQSGKSGFVRNDPDGSVYIEAEGDDARLLEFIAECKRGPIRAEVSSVHSEEAPLVHYHTFRIDR